MAAAPAAPAAGAALTEAALLAITLIAFLIWAIAYGMRGAWVHTIGWGLVQIAEALAHVPFGIGSWLKLQVLAVDDSVLNVFDTLIAGSDGLVGYLLHWVAQVFTWGVRETVALTHDVLGWAEQLQNVHLPKYVKWAVAALVPPVLIYRIARQVVTAELPHLRDTVRTYIRTSTTVVERLPKQLRREVTHDHLRIGALAAAVAALAGSLTWPHGISVPHVPELWRGLTKRLARIERRLRRLEGLLGVTGMAIAIANVLGIPNPRCLTKGPLGKVSRALCGLGGQALEDLLGLIVDAAVLGDPCDTMTILVDGAHLVMGPIDDLTGALDDAFGRCNYNLAAPLKVGNLYPPAHADLTLPAV